VYFTDRGRVILIASNFGRSRNPAWYHNVKANRIVTLYGIGICGHFMAEDIYGAERDRLFQRAKDAPGPFGQYEQAAAAQSRCVHVIAFTSQSRSEKQATSSANSALRASTPANGETR
jgi:deazaflavin-dependent oxidoreductase (nitroreductase family)